MKLIRYSKMMFLLLLIGMNISCDQITKHEVREKVQKHEIIKVIDSNLILTNVENTGAAMSLGSGLPPLIKKVVLQLFPILALFGMLGFLLLKTDTSKMQQVAMACIIGGGLGNLIDRIKFNSVTDFLFIEVGPLRTGIFNMADVSIFVGVLMMMVSSFLEIRSKQVEAELTG